MTNDPSNNYFQKMSILNFGLKIKVEKLEIITQTARKPCMIAS